MQVDRLLQFEERSHWCCRLHVSKLRVDWQFSTVSMGLIRSPILRGVCIYVCVQVYCNVCICIQLKETYRLPWQYAASSINCTENWVVRTACFHTHTDILVCAHKHSHTQRWSFYFRAVQDCIPGPNSMHSMKQNALLTNAHGYICSFVKLKPA